MAHPKKAPSSAPLAHGSFTFTARIWLLTLGAGLASATALAVTHVGNPGLRVHQWTPPAGGWSVDTATAASASAALQDCSTGAWTNWPAASPSTVLAVFNDAPAGTWCTVEVELVDVVLEVDGPSNRRVEAALDELSMKLSFVDAMAVAGSGDEVTWLHALGTGWLATAEVYVEPDETYVIDSETPGYAALVASLQNAKIYIDADEDGTLDAAEYAAGPIAE